MLIKPKLLHLERVPIRWGDMDALGHVNNTIYFRYMEQARISWMDTQGINNVQGDGPILGKASCRFIKPLVYPGVVEVSLTCTGVSNRSFNFASEVRKVGEDILYAEGEATMVWINFAAGRSQPLPEAIRRILVGEEIK